MVLNLTNKRLADFSVYQRLALQGESVVTVSRPVTTIDEFDSYLNRYENILSAIIVDKDIDVVLANDIINSVDVPVVTLDVEYLCDSNTYNFIEYGFV